LTDRHAVVKIAHISNFKQRIIMAWNWDKLQQQRGRHEGSPPQMDDILEKIKGMRNRFQGGWLIIIVILIFIMGFTMVYTVAVDEVGVIQRFGRYVRTTSPGLHFKLPSGIEKVTKVPLRRVQKEEFGFKTIQAGIQTKYISGSDAMGESLMLTGDLNVAVVPWIVQYRIDNPYNYLFKVKDIKGTLRDLSESTMRLVVGDRSINEVINKRAEIADEAKELLQIELDEAETGINLVTIEMKTTTVPEPVQPSWNEVNQAGQEKEKMIYQAQEEYNKLIPQAKGQAEKTIKEAEGYALDRVNRAKGDASRYLALYEEYSKAKDVTRRRLYLEALSDVFPKLGNKYIVDDDQKNLLPLINMGQQPTTGGAK
jgi:membrane protease subunit HflK